MDIELRYNSMFDDKTKNNSQKKSFLIQKNYKK